MYREDILEHAYRLAKADDGAPGPDGESFEDIESTGREEWLIGLRKELHDKTYRAPPVRRKMIAKHGGGERPLWIPNIRDRVVQTAAKLILEPIWEARRRWSNQHDICQDWPPHKRVRTCPRSDALLLS